MQSGNNSILAALGFLGKVAFIVGTVTLILMRMHDDHQFRNRPPFDVRGYLEETQQRNGFGSFRVHGDRETKR